MRKYLIALAVLASGSASAAAETWNVTRGEGDKVLKGEWNVTLGAGGAVTGVGSLGGPGRQPMKFKIGGSSNGGMFTLQTTGEGVPSCVYVGRDQSPAFGGQAVCGDEKSRWHVVRIR